MGLALGPMSRIMTRSLYVLLWSRHAWCEQLEFNRGVQRELEFWRSSSCVAQYNAQPIWLSPSAVKSVYSNVSDTGYWGYTVKYGGGGGGGGGGRDIRDGVVFEDIVGVLTCTPCAVHFNCYEIVL